ncbi:MAG: DUF424 domain-containing protein [Thermoproteota archaeon]|nr:DUF424 domain-containing protein [Thermoproteota archaeon]
MTEINQDYNYALRKIKYQETQMINICDLNLIGKEINQGDFSISISKDYFYSEEITEEDAIKVLKSSSIINLVGKDIVDLALSLNLAKRNSVKIIENVPFLMIFKFSGMY